MTDHVIIVGVNRGREQVPINEIIQACGRAGRKENEKGIVDIFIDDNINNFSKRFNESKSKNIESIMNDVESLAFHLISEIDSGRVKTTEQATKWIKRSFLYFQGLLDENIMTKTIQYLQEINAINKNSILLSSTNIGSIAAKLYFHPMDIKKWDENILTIYDLNILDDDVAISWCLGNIFFNKSSNYDIRGLFNIPDEFQSRLINHGLSCDGNLHTCMIWWSLLGNKSCSSMQSDMEKLKQDINRVISALKMIVYNYSNTKPELIDFVNKLWIRLKKRTSEEFVELFRMNGLSKNSVYELYNDFGITNEDGLREQLNMIEQIGSDGLKFNLKKMGIII